MNKTIEQTIRKEVNEYVDEAIANFDITEAINEKKIKALIDKHLDELVFRRLADALEKEILTAVNKVVSMSQPDIQRKVFQIAEKEILKDAQ